MNYQNFIVIDPTVRSGKPTLKGTRITVSDALEYMASGMTPAKICEDFPELTLDMLNACLNFAADRERHLHYPHSA